MNPIDFNLIQQALRNIDSALESLSGKNKSDPLIAKFSASLSLVFAKSNLRAAMIGNAPKETV